MKLVTRVYLNKEIDNSGSHKPSKSNYLYLFKKKGRTNSHGPTLLVKEKN
jgi:hypothetical protein